MKNVLKQYLHELSKAGTGSNLAATQLRYEKLTIYCIIGPEENIIHLTFTQDKHELARKLLVGLDNSITFKPLKQEDFSCNTVFNNYFTGKVSSLPIKTDSPFINAGTSFQQAVWRQISAIPYGRCITYRKLAELAGSPKGARAAGLACGANPLALIIPCHRVTASNGPGGFAGGLDIKRYLLALEQAGSSCI